MKTGLIGRLEELETLTKGQLVYDETSGLKQVFVREAVDPLMVLRTYYRGRQAHRA